MFKCVLSDYEQTAERRKEYDLKGQGFEEERQRNEKIRDRMGLEVRGII